MAKTIKEIIILLIACFLTMLLFAIALYQYIPSRKVVPEIAKYTATEEIQDLLEDNIDTKTDEDDVILTYEVTASDLKTYQTKNVYVPGKSNPFAAYTEQTTAESSGENTSGEVSNNEQEKNEKPEETKKTEEKSYEKSNGTK